MHHDKVHWFIASVAALNLGWLAACAPANEVPEHTGAAAGSGQTGGSVGVGGGKSSTAGIGATAGAATVGGTNAAGAMTGGAAAGQGVGAASMGGSAGVVNAAGVPGSMGGASGTGGTGGAAVTGGGGAAGTTTGGSSGVEEESCSMRPALTVPLLADFENYDGATTALDWVFTFNDGGAGSKVLYGGFFDAGDGSGMPTLAMVGSDTSHWAISATNTEASEWGGGIGLWLGCMDASSYTGISLAVRGSTPNQNAVDIAISVNGLTGAVRNTVTVTDLFTTFQLPFTDFTNENSETTNGDNIVGLSINAVMMWVQDEATEEWSIVPGAYEVVVDDITLY